jgi:hypothetical protein
VHRTSINGLRKQRGLPELTTDPPALDDASIVGTTDIRAANAIIGETGSIPGLKVGSIELSVSRNSPQYKGMLNELEKLPMLGKGGGAVDRIGAVDAAFAKTNGKPAPYQTADIKIFERLATKYGPPNLLAIPAGSAPAANPPVWKRIQTNLGATPGFTAKIPDGTGATHDVFVIPIFP